MIKKFLCSMLAAVLMIGAASCSSDNGPDTPSIPNDALYDIVTLTATSSNSSTFAAQKAENTPEVSYFSSVSFANNKNVKVGQRLLIAYKMQNGAAAYTTGPITLYGFSLLSNTEPAVITGTAAQYDGWNSETLKVTSLWLTGKFLNINAQMYTNTISRPTSYILVADETTLDKPVIEAHLILRSNTSDGGNLAPVYASFDIETLLNIKTCETLRVNYKDITGFSYQDFKNPNVTVRPID